MKLLIYKSVLINLICFLIVSTALADEPTSINLNGKQYAREKGKWYLVESTNSQFLVDTVCITVKLKKNVPDNAFNNLNAHNEAIILRQNVLGYIDLKFPASTKFYHNFNKYFNSGLFESVEVNTYGEFLEEPNDPMYGYQYNLYNIQNYPHINAENAWEIENGSTNPVTVASIDQGISPNNPELNYATGGYDFVENDTDPSPSTDDFHGINTASLFCAKTNNNSLMSSVSGGWNLELGAKVLVIRIGSEGFLNSNLVDEALYYAAENGAKIINMSIRTAETVDIKTAIDYISHFYGCIIVAAAGNIDKGTGVEFPARYFPVIAVGGISKEWEGYGRFGPSLDVLAPYEEIPVLKKVDEMDYVTGTSYAAPQVAGIGALLLSKRTSLTPKDFENILKYSSDPFQDPDYSCYGIVNAYNALISLTDGGYLPAPCSTITLSGSQGQNPTISWTITPPSSMSITKSNVYRACSSTGRYYFTKVGEVTYNSLQQNYSWVDQSIIQGGGATYYYRVATQTSGNIESVLSPDVYTTGISPDKKNISAGINFQYNLSQNYPNPYNPTTSLKYSLKEDGIVSLKIYDVLGSVVKEIKNEFQQAGEYSTKINLSDQASGIYFCKITVNNFQKTIKLIFNK